MAGSACVDSVWNRDSMYSVSQSGLTIKKPARRAFHDVAGLSAPGAVFRVSPLLTDLLRSQPVTLFDDGIVVALDKVLRFQSIVLHALMGKEVYRHCFLTQGISTVFFVAEDAKDAPGLQDDRPLTVGMPLFVRKSAI